MLLIQNLHTDKEAIKLRLAKRGTDFSALIDHAIALDNQRKEIQTQLDDILAQSNQLAKSIGQLFAQKKIEEATLLKSETGNLKDKVLP